jgi:hypothetical protein
VLLVLIGAAALILLVLRQLRALVADVDAGSPFALIALIASLWASGHMHQPGVTFAVTFPLEVTPLGAGSC